MNKIPKTVSVAFDEQTQTLSVDSTTVTLELHDDWVSWVSSTTSPLPSGATLMIVFEQPLGPFQALRGASPQSLVAKGNSGVVDEFSYFLYLLSDPNEPDNLIKAGPFTVDNQCSEIDRSPWVHVTYKPLAPIPSERLEIKPNPLLLHEGDVAFWVVSDVPEDFPVAFWYPAENSTVGPFPTYFVTRNSLSGSERLGAAIFAGGEDETIHYGVKVWDADGVLVASKDPSIDNLGRPPGT